MNWQRFAAPALVALLAGACSGDSPQEPSAAADLTTTTTEAPVSTTAPSATEAPVSTTSSAPSDDAPNTLAFASTSDIGRLFELDGSSGPIPAYEAARSGAESTPLFGGSLVQAANARSVDGSLWVLVAEPEGERLTIGWVPVDFLLPTTRSILSNDARLVGELRRVATTVRNDALPVHTSPGGGSVVANLAETSIGMHGGATTITSTGERWVDVIDPSTRSRIGWVTAAEFTTVRRIEAKYEDSTDVERRAGSGVVYGASLRTGEVTVVGCNAAQISFSTAAGSAGTAILFGNAEPTGQVSRGSSTFRWSSSGGSTVYAAPGETIIFTFPTDGPKSWYFAALDADLQGMTARNADGTPVVDPNGKAIISNAQQFFLDGGSCVYTAPVEEEEDPNGLDPYILDLPPDERDAAIAAFEESQNPPDEDPVVEADDTSATEPEA